MTKVLFCGGQYIKPLDDNEPYYREHSKLWFCAGYRWIKSKKKWSTNALLHNFGSYEWIDESELDNL